MCALGWDKLARMGQALTTLALDIPGMWVQALPECRSSLGVDDGGPGLLTSHLTAGQQTPLGCLLAEVCAAAPVLERLSLMAVLPGAASNAPGCNAPAYDAGALPAAGAAPFLNGGAAAVHCHIRLPPFARLQVLRSPCQRSEEGDLEQGCCAGLWRPRGRRTLPG